MLRVPSFPQDLPVKPSGFLSTLPQNTARQPQAKPAKPKVLDMAKVAFIGLGVMGFPMAGHLVKKGSHEVTVFNRNAAKAKA